MNQTKKLTVTALAVLLLPGAATTGEDDRRQEIVFKVGSANSKYTQQHTIEVGDTPGHQVRLFEVRRTYPTDAPVINGLKIVESWSRGASDYTNNTGAAIVYHVYIAENGDKFFVQSSTAAVQGQGTEKMTTTTVGPVTGGTGSFANIQGFLRASVTADLKAGANETEIRLEYWFSK
jgi:hypothetical protein